MNFLQILKLLSLLALTEGAVILYDREVDIRDIEKIDISEAPYEVSIKWVKDYPTYSLLILCGGTIIAEDLVLTAARCLRPQDIGNYTVRAGSSYNYPADDGQVINPKSFKIHEKFDAKTLDYDIALIRLEEAFKFNDKVQKIALAAADLAVNPGDSCNITGWRKVHFPHNMLRRKNLEIGESKTCKDFFVNQAPIFTDNKICVKSLDDEDNIGDDGSPIVRNGVQIGISSWGWIFADKKSPAMATSVPKLRKWIDENSKLI